MNRRDARVLALVYMIVGIAIYILTTIQIFPKITIGMVIAGVAAVFAIILWFKT